MTECLVGWSNEADDDLDYEGDDEDEDEDEAFSQGWTGPRWMNHHR